MVCCVKVVLDAVERLLDTAIEMDTGRYGSMSCAVIMYALRLTVRLEGYLGFVCDHASWFEQLTLPAGNNTKNGGENRTRNGPKSFTRGLELHMDLDADTLSLLRAARQRLATKVREQATPILERCVKDS